MLRFVTLAVALVCTSTVAAEGKWTPQQVQQQGSNWLKQQGFSLPLPMLWNEKTQTGLLGNAVQLPGCSGSFVSAQGLLITNHHCIVSILQEHSTPQQNLSRDGFVAKTSADEKKSSAFRLLVPRRFSDVTKEVLAALPANPDPLTRFKSIEATQKQLVAECEKTRSDARCTFASFDGGLFFTLTEFTEFSDVRLVYAPPSAVGDFGGETDNWTWPRHSGDFALVRVYADGKPYQPAQYFPLSKEGVKENDAVAVLGYPGSSFRALLADDMAERRDRYYPALQALTGEWQSIMEEESKRSSEAAIAVADDLRGLVNAKKNAEGQLAGLARGRIIERQKESDERVKAYVTKHPEHAAALDAYRGLVELATERTQTWNRDFLLDMLPRAGRPLSWPSLLARRSVEAQRPDVEREPGYQERDLPRLRERHERDQKRFNVAVDSRLMASWVKHALALGREQRIAAVDAVFAGVESESAIAKKCADLMAASKVLDLEVRKRAFDETPEQLKARHDPLLDLGLALDAERRALRDRREVLSGKALERRPVWRKGVIAEAGHPVAPDANSTLRVSFCRVRGYSPREAVQLTPHTTLAGVMAKHTGTAPFDVPARIRDVYASNDRHARVPVDFLADCDTTGGNSGSPVIDSKGRLVGVNFDRVWENVANDFGYNPEVARNVSADVRYLLWLLNEVDGAPELAAELTRSK